MSSPITATGMRSSRIARWRSSARSWASRGIYSPARLGVTPVGFRTPSGDWSDETASMLAEFGVIYSSSMRGDDRPYFHRRKDGSRGLVEIPARWDIDDYTALAYFEDPDFPIGLDRISDYRLVEQNWRHEFLGYYREGLCWTTIFHPKVVRQAGTAEHSRRAVPGYPRVTRMSGSRMAPKSPIGGSPRTRAAS